jgi:hypothetical protein
MQVQVSSHKRPDMGWNRQRTTDTSCLYLSVGIWDTLSSYGAGCCWIWCFHTVCRAWRRRSARERHAAAAWMLFGAASSRGLWDKSRRSHPGRLEMMEMGEEEDQTGSWGALTRRTRFVRQGSLRVRGKRHGALALGT